MFFWCFYPCKSSPCDYKKEGKWCLDCKMRAWETEKELDSQIEKE